MKNTLKTILFEKFEQKIAEAYPDMSEVNRRRIAALMQNVAMDIIQDNSDGLADNYSKMCLELETNKKMFREHIESIQKAYKVIFDAFKKNGIISMDIDRKTNRPVMKAKTTVVAEMVEFLNYLNNLTMDFYENVYKIEDSADRGSTQTTLF